MKCVFYGSILDEDTIVCIHLYLLSIVLPLSLPHIQELWALLHFADKVKFANQKEFLDQFRDLKDATQVAKLHTMLKPYLLRR